MKPRYPLSESDLRAVLTDALAPRHHRDALRFVDQLATSMADAEVNTRDRAAHFLAQVAHESAGFHYTEELASGAAYEGRLDLGNTEPGDGRRFKGRGLIQLTGRHNYGLYTRHHQARGGMEDFLRDPELVATRYPADVAAWYWTDRDLNRLADAGDDEAALKRVTRAVNGGLNGYADRLRYFRAFGRSLNRLG